MKFSYLFLIGAPLVSCSTSCMVVDLHDSIEIMEEFMCQDYKGSMDLFPQRMMEPCHVQNQCSTGLTLQNYTVSQYCDVVTSFCCSNEPWREQLDNFFNTCQENWGQIIESNITLRENQQL
ncbi:hypothetical protein BCR42DRAFT_428026 [Absidia repens]|uniref:Extracellular membrane protein CFEM domain-containing protein n=1 Tax=Absidia repens TaxID=90262 RepID=A0A1X2HYU8_9FUNG|nr:hypothetical protein BCR42DRAFT_428026 [Absidia repens]